MPRISVTLSALVKIGVALSPLAENKKKKKKKKKKSSLYALISLSLDPSNNKKKNEEEEATKANLLLIGVKATGDKTWGRD